MPPARRFYAVAALFVLFLIGAVVRATDHGARLVDLIATSGAAIGFGVAVGSIVALRRTDGPRSS